MGTGIGYGRNDEPGTSKPVKKTRLVFCYPGSLFEETVPREVTSRELPTDAPPECFAFFFEDYFVTPMHDGTRERLVESEPLNPSMRYYPEATVLDEACIRAFQAALPNDDPARQQWDRLLFNMKARELTRAIRTRRGNLVAVSGPFVVL